MRAPSFEPDPSPVDPEANGRHREIIIFMAVVLLLLLYIFIKLYYHNIMHNSSFTLVWVNTYVGLWYRAR